MDDDDAYYFMDVEGEEGMFEEEEEDWEEEEEGVEEVEGDVEGEGVEEQVDEIQQVQVQVEQGTTVSRRGKRTRDPVEESVSVARRITRSMSNAMHQNKPPHTTPSKPKSNDKQKAVATLPTPPKDDTNPHYRSLHGTSDDFLDIPLTTQVWASEEFRRHQEAIVQQCGVLCGVPSSATRGLLWWAAWNRERLLERFMEKPLKVMQAAGIVSDQTKGMCEM